MSFSIAASSTEIENFLRMMETFHHGGFSYVTTGSPLTFCGMKLIRRRDGRIGLTQDSYRQQVPRIQTSEFYGPQACYTTTEQTHRIGGNVVGSLLWMVQSRFDIAYFGSEVIYNSDAMEVDGMKAVTTLS